MENQSLRGEQKVAVRSPALVTRPHPRWTKMCYNMPMPVKVTFRKELSEEEKMLAECARAASRDAVKAAPV